MKFKIPFFALMISSFIHAQTVPAPTITAQGKTAFCQGGSVILQSNVTTGNQWYKNNVAIAGATTQEYAAGSSGSYSVKIGTVSSNSISVSVFSKPAISISPSGTLTICPTNGLVLSASNSEYSLTWSTGETSENINVTTSGNYYVTATNFNGCSSTSNITTVNALPQPVITADGSTTFCNGDSVRLTTSPGTSYLWSTGEKSQSVMVKTGGNYSVTVTDSDASSCTQSAPPVTVIVNPLPIVDAGSDQVLYLGYGNPAVTLSATATGTNPLSFLWDTGDETQSITVSPVTTTNYTVTVTDSNSCQASDKVTVEVIDVSCETERVLICHNTGNGEYHTICVAQSSVPMHLEHGDYLGSCTSTAKIIQNQEAVYEVSDEVEVFPNPSDGSQVRLLFKDGRESSLLITLVDVTGKVYYNSSVMINKENNFTTQLDIKNKLAAGVYFLNATGTDKFYTRKIIISD